MAARKAITMSMTGGRKVKTNHGKVSVHDYYSFPASGEANNVTMETAGILTQSATIRIATFESTVLLPSLQTYCCQYCEPTPPHGIQSAASTASVELHSSLK